MSRTRWESRPLRREFELEKPTGRPRQWWCRRSNQQPDSPPQPARVNDAVIIRSRKPKAGCRLAEPDCPCVSDGVKNDQTCRFEIQLPQKLDGSSIRYRLDGCRSGSRVGLADLEGSWPKFEEGRNAGADSGRKRPDGRGKTVDSSPATFCGFRNDADTLGPHNSSDVSRTGKKTLKPPSETWTGKSYRKAKIAGLWIT